MSEMVTALALLQREVDAWKSEARHWRANHDAMVMRLQFALQRPDLPADRIPVAEAAQARIKQLEAEVAALTRRLEALLAD